MAGIPELATKRPRVLFLNPGLYALGGMQAWLAELMPGLEEEGLEVFLGVADGRWQQATGYLAAFPWPRAVRVRNGTGTRLGARKAVVRALRRLRPELLVVAHLVSALEAVAWMRARGEPAPKLVVSFHALSAGFLEDLGRFRSVVDAVILPTRLLVEAARLRSGLPSNRILHGPYAVQVPGAPPELRGEPGRLRVLYAHRLENDQKRVFDLVGIVQALERLGVGFELEVVGSGPDEEELRQRLEALELRSGSIRLAGGVLPAQLLGEKLLPDRTLLVTSQWENGPMVVFQAMARGVPVVSSRYLSSGLEGILRHEETALLFDIGDCEGAAKQLARARLPELRRRLRGTAWTVVFERLERSRVAGHWASMLRQVLAWKPQGRPDPPPAPPPRGRLDRWLGVGAAEWLRCWLRWPARVGGPGDEWPHTLGGGISDEDYLSWLFQLEHGLLERG